MGVKWTGSAVDGDDDSNPPTVEEWRPVSVPESAAFADSDGAVAYRTTFEDPRADGDERGWLELDGFAARAEIRLNGTTVGTLEPYVGRFRRTFDPLPENELIVVCKRLDDRRPERTTPARRLETTIESRSRTFLRGLEVRPRFTDDGGVIDVDLEAVGAGTAAIPEGASCITVTVAAAGRTITNEYRL